MKLIVWLGNPWAEYAKTRHNVGFMIVEDFLEQERQGLGTRKRGTGTRWNGESQEIVIDDQLTGQVGKKIIFLKPMEYMNRSWWAVSQIANFYKIEPKDILVIHDDIDLPVGKIQLKLWWSSAGHNWLKSIIEKLWTKEYWRLRIGVDRPSNQAEVSDYVLSTFSKEEKECITSKMSEIEEHIHKFLLM